MTAPDTSTQDDLLVLLPRLRRYAWVLTADPRRADDLVLETLGWASGRKQSSPAPWRQLRQWLFAAMHRLHRDRLVREPHTPPAPLARFASDELPTRFSRLPAEQREVLALVVLEGLPYTEIADVLEVPVATVMSRLHIAREGMRAMPAGHHDQSGFRKS